MSNSIGPRIAKLEARPQAVPARVAVWEFAAILRAELQHMVKAGTPIERTVAQEIVRLSDDRLRTLADLSTPAVHMVKDLLTQRIARSGRGRPEPCIQDNDQSPRARRGPRR